MLIIRTSADMAAAIASPIDVNLRFLLALRRDQLTDHSGYDLGELAQFIVAEPGDTLHQIEAAMNYPILPDPPWEWVLDHGDLFEAPIIVSDGGFGFVLIVPDIEGADAELIRLLRHDAKVES